MTRKQPANGVSGFGRAMTATSSAAQQAVPVARTAGVSMKQGADGAVAWATPYVGAARHWAAPRLEQSAAVLSETIAPIISDALVNAARKIDYVEPKRRVNKSSLFAGSMLVIAAGCATAFALLHRQETDAGFTAATTPPDAAGPSPDRIVGGPGDGNRGMPDVGESDIS